MLCKGWGQLGTLVLQFRETVRLNGVDQMACILHKPIFAKIEPIKTPSRAQPSELEASSGSQQADTAAWRHKDRWLCSFMLEAEAALAKQCLMHANYKAHVHL